MHGTARCFGYPSDSSPTARQQASWTLSAGDQPAYYDYADDRRRHLRHRAWLLAVGRGAMRAGSRDPGPGRSPPLRHRPWSLTRPGPVPRAPGLDGSGAGRVC